jgi:hypothetical protein
MGIVEYELTRLRQQEIKVKSLVALAKYGNQHQKFKALAKLEKFAYPKDLADKINQQPLDMYDEEF